MHFIDFLLQKTKYLAFYVKILNRFKDHVCGVQSNLCNANGSILDRDNLYEHLTIVF